jgi:hypothetical protein
VYGEEGEERPLGDIWGFSVTPLKMFKAHVLGNTPLFVDILLLDH